VLAIMLGDRRLVQPRAEKAAGNRRTHSSRFNVRAATVVADWQRTQRTQRTSFFHPRSGISIIVDTVAALQLLLTHHRNARALEGGFLVSPSSDLQVVVAALPYFRIRTREEFEIAEQMIVTLVRNLETLTEEQWMRTKTLKTQLDRYRAVWGGDGTGGEATPWRGIE
jgi:hypothetical protein